MSAPESYRRLLDLAREIRLLESVSDLLGWDQEVVMPHGGGVWRARELELLARLSHQRQLDPEYVDCLARCADDLSDWDADSPARAVLRELHRQQQRAARLPAALVGEIAEVQSLAQRHWAEAREQDDFASFRPWLARLVGLMRDKAACLRDERHGEDWDALADEFEPGMSVAGLRPVFDELSAELRVLHRELRGSGRAPDDSLRDVALPIDDQERFVRRVAREIGFDSERGRIDRSSHPFCSGTHPGDVRITTRFQPTDFIDALGSTMHECGHALYEQGLPEEHAGTPLATAVSLGIHESQSRLWENRVGRSPGFWRWCQPLLGEYFSDALDRYDAAAFCAAANRVRPSLIRVEADEATYDLHVVVRFELEVELIRGELQVKDLPERWNAAYSHHLGIDVPDDRRGCLQDVHWSCGLFGYFPTYTLGNLYSAQLFEAAEAELGPLDEAFARGEFVPLRSWLQQQVHRHGSRWSPAELCLRVTGRPLSVAPMMRALRTRLEPLYRPS